MAGTGITMSFLRKRVAMGDMVVVIASFLVSAVSWNIGKNDLKLKRIDHISLGAQSMASGGFKIRQNLRSATTVEAGTIHGESFTSGNDFILMIYGV